MCLLCHSSESCPGPPAASLYRHAALYRWASNCVRCVWYNAINCDIYWHLLIVMCCYVLVLLLLLIRMCIYYFKCQCLREKENVQSSQWFQNKSIWTFYIFNFNFLVSRNNFSVCVPRMQNSFMLHNGTLTLHSLNTQRCMCEVEICLQSQNMHIYYKM